MSKTGSKLYPTVGYPTLWISFKSNLDTTIADIILIKINVFAVESKILNELAIVDDIDPI